MSRKHKHAHQICLFDAYDEYDDFYYDYGNYKTTQTTTKPKEKVVPDFKICPAEKL